MRCLPLLSALVLLVSCSSEPGTRRSTTAAPSGDTEGAVVGLWRLSLPYEPQPINLKVGADEQWAWWTSARNGATAEPTQSGTWFIRKGTFYLRVKQTESDKILPNMVFAFDLKSVTTNEIVADWNGRELKCERVR